MPGGCRAGPAADHGDLRGGARRRQHPRARSGHRHGRLADAAELDRGVDAVTSRLVLFGTDRRQRLRDAARSAAICLVLSGARPARRARPRPTRGSTTSRSSDNTCGRCHCSGDLRRGRIWRRGRAAGPSLVGPHARAARDRRDRGACNAAGRQDRVAAGPVRRSGDRSRPSPCRRPDKLIATAVVTAGDARAAHASTRPPLPPRQSRAEAAAAAVRPAMSALRLRRAAARPRSPAASRATLPRSARSTAPRTTAAGTAGRCHRRRTRRQSTKRTPRFCANGRTAVAVSGAASSAQRKNPPRGATQLTVPVKRALRSACVIASRFS